MAVRWPRGFSSGAAAAGIKSEGLDVGMLVADRAVSWTGTFTKNAAAAASVHWSRGLLDNEIRAVVVNSGNANACTGTAGERAVEEVAGAVATSLGCRAQEVAVASTGPIGVPLPVARVCSGARHAVSSLSADVSAFSQAILTTDSRPKIAATQVRGAHIVGVAKGAAMLAPSMATMLAFIATDASLSGEVLGSSLRTAVSRSFDRISVDACESTNDSVFLLTSGCGGAPDASEFESALTEICRSLAEEMVRDAEGGSRLVRIQVAGASDEGRGVALAKGVAASVLWRAALHGGDPNWGRVLAALGTIDRDLELPCVDVSIGDAAVFRSGSPTGSLEAAAAEMQADEFNVFCRVGQADTFVELLTTDLSPDYVRLNATGTS
jgi:glutamate N-acetyltransferase / amino-acid N-acetyltransferase